MEVLMTGFKAKERHKKGFGVLEKHWLNKQYKKSTLENV
jgi:hypothetical protein